MFEYPIIFNPLIADKIGLVEAILISDLIYDFAGKQEFEIVGHISLTEIHRLNRFPFLTEEEINKAFESLKKQNLIDYSKLGDKYLIIPKEKYE